MLKKGFIALFIIILIAIGIFSIIHLFSPDKNSAVEDASIPKEDNAGDTENAEENKENDEENENNEDEGSPISEKVSEIISGVIQNAADFFANKETNVVAIGDSLTEGVGDETGNGGYIGVIEDIVNEKEQVATFENFGRRGNRSGQMLERMDEPDIDNSLQEADIILITIGANDVMEIVKENITDLKMDVFKEERIDYETRLEEIFDGMIERNDDADIYLLGFYNPFKRFFDIRELDTIVDEWNKTGEDLAADYEQANFIPTKDLFEDTENEKELLSSDNFHPNQEGYQLMAKRVLENVTE